MLCRLQKSAFLFAFRLSDVCAVGNFQPLTGSDKVQVAGSWAHYWSTCVYLCPVLDEAHGLSHSGVVAKRALQLSSSPDISSSSLAQWLVEGFIFPTCRARLFSGQVKSSLCGKSIPHTAGLGKYSWSQSCLLKWVDRCAHWWCCWCSSNPGTAGVTMWNCSSVFTGSLRTAAVTLFLSSYSWAAVSPLHLWREDIKDLLSRCHESKQAWLKNSSTLAYTEHREAGMEGYRELYLYFP